MMISQINNIIEGTDYKLILYKIFGSEAQLLEISKRVEWGFCVGEYVIIYHYVGNNKT